jgi:hypothetical protein
MSTLFRKCTLVDPTGKIDVRIVDANSFFLEKDEYHIKKNPPDTDKKEPKLQIQATASTHHKLSDEIKIVIDNETLGYIPDCLVEYLMPFYHYAEAKGFTINDFFIAEIHRLNPSIDGVGGISIIISINDKVNIQS